MSRKFSVFTFVLFSMAVTQLQAAMVTFSAVANLASNSSGAEVDNATGTYQFAWNTGGALDGSSGTTVSVNGVTFYGVANTVTPSGITISTTTTANTLSLTNRAPSYLGSMQTLMTDNFLTDEPVTDTFSMTFNGLVATRDYRVQFLMSDQFAGAARTMTISSGSDVSASFSAAGTGVGKYLFATFTADAATQTFTFNHPLNHRAVLNGISIFTTSIIPEPCSLSLTAMAAVAMCGMVRRRNRQTAC
jgi:hypothetical protein